ncbi:DUF1499 domain-containing protein [Alteromonas sp. 14N.309.X.WAT.G.H12]|uniref:DUF1499 domain-containing protein n=1 Tax=Alteromonas sp. 14N.309.X.WAT.G.H12 TaxID=3120824 RepID=UPI002FCFC8D5
MNVLVIVVAIVGLFMVLLPGPLYKFELLDLHPAFTCLRWGVCVGISALVLLIVQALFVRKTMRAGTTIATLVSVLISVGIPLHLMQTGRSVPPIHDITTDVNMPPAFVGVLPARSGAINPPDYDGDEVASQQKEAYPDIKTQVFQADFETVSMAAQAVIDDLGWTLVTQNTRPNTLEATHTSFWFGFKDDVVVRFTQQGTKTLVDIRSKSRVGRSDLGANAERIRAFQSKLKERLE